jgi:hypothetical protein
MHPLARPGNKSGGNSGGPYEVRAGDKVYYDIDGRTGVLDECLQDGDALITWDDGTFGKVKWNHLSPIRGPGTAPNGRE